jgi:hypothetical protein
MKRILTFATLGVLAAVGVAFAQSVPVPQVSVIHPTTDLIQVVPNGQPSAQAQFAQPAALSSQELYAKVALTGASTYTTTPGYSNTFSNYQSDIMITAPGTIPYLYFTFAPNPSDGARECMYSNQTVTAATPVANTTVNPQVVNANNTITSLTASTRVCFLFSASNLTWDRD